MNKSVTNSSLRNKLKLDFYPNKMILNKIFKLIKFEL